jgi:transcriptional regulator GlxA family with amidase domain
MQSPLTVSIALPSEAEPSVAVGVHDALWAAGVLWNRIMGEAEVPCFLPQFVAATTNPVVTATGVSIAPHRTFREAPNADIIFVPTILISSGGTFGRHNPEIIQWLRRSYAAGAYIYASCTGSFALAEAGLLDGRDATTHWAFAQKMQNEYPDVRVHGDRVLVAASQDTRIVTCGGAASWMDMILYIVGRFAGAEVAMRLAKVQMYDWHHQGQTPYARLTSRPQAGDRQILESQEWLADHYAEADPVSGMVRRSGLSPRSFGRRFKSATGFSPMEYAHRVRIEEAKQILETTSMTVEQVGAAVGYGDAASFRRLFNRMVSETPAAYRRRQAISEAAREISRLSPHPAILPLQA